MPRPKFWTVRYVAISMIGVCVAVALKLVIDVAFFLSLNFKWVLACGVIEVPPLCTVRALALLMCARACSLLPALATFDVAFILAIGGFGFTRRVKSMVFPVSWWHFF